MELTRERAIEEHRKMWNWFAEQIEASKRVLRIGDLKDDYFLKKHKTRPIEGCYLCQYAYQEWLYCSDCIVEKPEGTGCLGGLYSEVALANCWEKQAELARKIANLPEREVSND